MNVKDVCIPLSCPCRRETSLAEAANLMWERDIGALPVLDDEGVLVGVVTDRDIAMAVAKRHRLASDLQVGEVMSGKTSSCSQEDGLGTVLDTMRREQLRRLPVLDKKGRLQGMITINDIIRAVQATKGLKLHGGISEQVMLTLMAISVPHRKELELAPASPPATPNG
jgi:CBS-domain-containing membrane protein